MSGEELRAAAEALDLWLIRPNPADIRSYSKDDAYWDDLAAALAAPSTPEPSGRPRSYWQEFLDWEAEAAAQGSGMTQEQMTGAAMFRSFLVNSAPDDDTPEQPDRPAPSTGPALDADQQFTAVDKSLLATFQWSDKEYKRFGLAASAFLNHLHDIGWDVTVRDPEKAAEYARLAESQ